VEQLPREIFERDPSAYIEALRDFAESYEVNELEQEVLGWAVHTAGARSEDLDAVALAGFMLGVWEDWRDDLAAVSIGTFPGHRENEQRRYLEAGMPEGDLDLVYSANHIRVQLEKFDADPALMTRLDHVFEEGVIGMYAEGYRPKGEMRDAVRLFFELGVGVALALEREGELIGSDSESARYSGEIEVLGNAPDPLAGVNLPMEVRGSTLTRHDIWGYVLRQEGPMGGVQETTFTAEGDTANIRGMVKVGRLGMRPQNVPPPRHVDALRDLGFAEMVWPNGKRYRLSSWGGLSGIRRVRN
jgi:hypothetical protein